MSGWTLLKTDQYFRDEKFFLKKRPAEMQACIDNLERYFDALSLCGNPLKVTGIGTRPEATGVIALDQRGGGKNLIPLRLYIYPDKEKCILHVIKVGDKKSQQEDNNYCKNYVKKIRGGYNG